MEGMYLSSVPCLINIHLSFVSCLMYSVSHVFCVSNHASTSTSRNQSCVIRIEIRGSWRNRMYIERADNLYSVELSDQSHTI